MRSEIVIIWPLSVLLALPLCLPISPCAPDCCSQALLPGFTLYSSRHFSPQGPCAPGWDPLSASSGRCIILQVGSLRAVFAGRTNKVFSHSFQVVFRTRCVLWIYFIDLFKPEASCQTLKASQASSGWCPSIRIPPFWKRAFWSLVLRLSKTSSWVKPAEVCVLMRIFVSRLSI